MAEHMAQNVLASSEVSVSHYIKAPRKLIEVALPLDDINVASAREKSIPARAPLDAASVVGAAAPRGGTSGVVRSDGQ
jgi:hypothetical protein